jgi:hypothetical protein
MFKKTLLAVSILGSASFAANAGQLSASVTEAADIVAGLPTDSCIAAATALGVTVDMLLSLTMQLLLILLHQLLMPLL